MSVNYSSQFKTRVSRQVTPQSKPIPGSKQVANSAGGFSWKVTPWQSLERFLILGAEGGTFYVAERELVKQSHDSILTCLKEDGIRAVKMIVDISTDGRAYKNDPAIFALALAAVHGSPETKAEAYAALGRVCRIGTHLFHFAEYVSAMRGWGRGLRKAVASWYDKQPDKLALQVVKYQSRDKWSHRDLLRLSHAKADGPGQGAIFRWVLKGMDGFETKKHEVVRKVHRKVGSEIVMSQYKTPAKKHLPALIGAFEEAKTASESQLVKLITEHNLPREAVPTEKLNSLQVWDALLEGMPLTAMIRNLGKMASIGLLKPLSAASKLVVERLGDQEALQKAHVHPMQILLALKTFASGQGLKGSLTWQPVGKVVEALDAAFYKAFKNVQPCGKPVLLAMDVSGSMDGSVIAGTCLTAREGAAAMALVTAAVEPECEIIAFSAPSTGGYGGMHGGGESGIEQLKITPRMRLDEVVQVMKRVRMGGTDCALPMIWAARNKIEVAGFVTYTDSETWAGAIHPSQALRDYRKQFVQDARGVVVGMCSNGFTIADTNDRWMLDVVGFDANVPSVISNFIRGEAAPAAAKDEAPEL